MQPKQRPLGRPVTVALGAVIAGSGSRANPQVRSSAPAEPDRQTASPSTSRGTSHASLAMHRPTSSALEGSCPSIGGKSASRATERPAASGRATPVASPASPNGVGNGHVSGIPTKPRPQPSSLPDSAVSRSTHSSPTGATGSTKVTVGRDRGAATKDVLLSSARSDATVRAPPPLAPAWSSLGTKDSTATPGSTVVPLRRLSDSNGSVVPSGSVSDLDHAPRQLSTSGGMSSPRHTQRLSDSGSSSGPKRRPPVAVEKPVSSTDFPRLEPVEAAVEAVRAPHQARTSFSSPRIVDALKQSSSGSSSNYNNNNSSYPTDTMSASRRSQEEDTAARDLEHRRRRPLVPLAGPPSLPHSSVAAMAAPRHEASPARRLERRSSDSMQSVPQMSKVVDVARVSALSRADTDRGTPAASALALIAPAISTVPVSSHTGTTGRSPAEPPTNPTPLPLMPTEKETLSRLPSVTGDAGRPSNPVQPGVITWHNKNDNDNSDEDVWYDLGDASTEVLMIAREREQERNSSSVLTLSVSERATKEWSSPTGGHHPRPPVCEPAASAPPPMSPGSPWPRKTVAGGHLQAIQAFVDLPAGPKGELPRDAASPDLAVAQVPPLRDLRTPSPAYGVSSTALPVAPRYAASPPPTPNHSPKRVTPRLYRSASNGFDERSGGAQERPGTAVTSPSAAAVMRKMPSPASNELFTVWPRCQLHPGGCLSSTPSRGGEVTGDRPKSSVPLGDAEVPIAPTAMQPPEDPAGGSGDGIANSVAGPPDGASPVAPLAQPSPSEAVAAVKAKPDFQHLGLLAIVAEDEDDDMVLTNSLDATDRNRVLHYSLAESVPFTVLPPSVAATDAINLATFSGYENRQQAVRFLPRSDSARSSFSLGERVRHPSLTGTSLRSPPPPISLKRRSLGSDHGFANSLNLSPGHYTLSRRNTPLLLTPLLGPPAATSQEVSGLINSTSTPARARASSLVKSRKPQPETSLDRVRGSLSSQQGTLLPAPVQSLDTSGHSGDVTPAVPSVAVSTVVSHAVDLAAPPHEPVAVASKATVPGSDSDGGCTSAAPRIQAFEEEEPHGVPKGLLPCNQELGSLRTAEGDDVNRMREISEDTSSDMGSCSATTVASCSTATNSSLDGEFSGSEEGEECDMMDDDDDGDQEEDDYYDDDEGYDYEIQYAPVPDIDVSKLPPLPRPKKVIIVRNVSRRYLASKPETERREEESSMLAASSRSRGNGAPAVGGVSGGDGEAEIRELGQYTGRETLDLSLTVFQRVGVALAPSKTLRVVSLRGSKVTSDGLRGLLDIPSLEELNVAQADGVRTLVPLLSSPGAAGSRLRVLEMQGSPVGDSGLDGISMLQHLQRLDLSMTLITSVAALEGLPCLRELALVTTGVGNDGLRGIERLPSLRVLDASVTPISTVAPLAGMERLEELYMRSTRVDDAGIAAIGLIPNLRVLEVSATKITTLAALAACRSLVVLHAQWLVLKHWGEPPGRRRQSSDEKLRRSTETAEGTLPWGSHIATEEESIAGLAQIPTLELLNLSHNAIRSVNSLATCPVLRTLLLRRTRVDNDGFVGVAQIQTLRTLVVSNAGNPYVSDATVDEFGLLSEVDVLANLSGCLTRLDLSFTDVFDLRSLAHLKSLQELSVVETLVTEEGLSGIETIPSLEFLDISQTSVTTLAFLGTGCPSLAVLLARSNRNVSGLCVKGLGGVSTLRYVDFSDTIVTSIETLFSTRSSVEVFVWRWGERRDIAGLIAALPFAVTEEVIAGIELLPHLRELDLAGSSVRSLRRLRAIPHLRRLILAENRALDNFGLRGIQQLPELEYLDLSGTKISNIGTLSGSRTIRTLLLGRSAVTAEGVTCLPTLENLAVLDVTLTPAAPTVETDMKLKCAVVATRTSRTRTGIPEQGNPAQGTLPLFTEQRVVLRFLGDATSMADSNAASFSSTSQLANSRGLLALPHSSLVAGFKDLRRGTTVGSRGPATPGYSRRRQSTAMGSCHLHLIQTPQRLMHSVSIAAKSMSLSMSSVTMQQRGNGPPAGHGASSFMSDQSTDPTGDASGSSGSSLRPRLHTASELQSFSFVGDPVDVASKWRRVANRRVVFID